jgi:pimeloyl-ACP methyl ester carboxylesterase
MDRFLPVHDAQRAVNQLPNVTFHVLPGVGHSPNWEAPEQVLELALPFLERLERLGPPSRFP